MFSSHTYERIKALASTGICCAIFAACTTTDGNNNLAQTLGITPKYNPTQVEIFEGTALDIDNPYRAKPKPTYVASAEAESPMESFSGSPEEQMNKALALVKKGDGQGAKHIEVLANQGYAAAQYNLGVMYSTGNGVKKNQKKGIELIQSAADKGHIKASTTLASMYLQGNGVRKNPANAKRYFLQAAQKGDAGAMMYLSLMHQRGDGVSKDPVEAYKWLLAIPQQNAAGVKKNVDAMKTHLSPAQQQQAQQRASQFRSQYQIS